MGFNNSPKARYVAFEELSSGKGFVDILFKPQKGTNELPMLVELKQRTSTKKAIVQIHDKDYIDYLKKNGYKGNVLLVDANYSTRKKAYMQDREDHDLKENRKVLFFMLSFKAFAGQHTCI